MSKIEYYGKIDAILYNNAYKKILQQYINNILTATNENDDNITWYICREEDLPNTEMKKILLEKERKMTGIASLQYGRSITANNQIWISLSAIKTALFSNPHEETILIHVIIDELAHIKTQKDHGDQEYEKKYN